jgi:hypothetical protein
VFHINKAAVIRTLSAQSGYDSEMQELLDTFTTKEIRILRRYPDLIDRIYQISQMTNTSLLEVLDSEHDLRPAVSPAGTADCWLSLGKLNSRIPLWYPVSHVGLWFDGKEGSDFREFGQFLLLQEVRVNLWMRYIEYKKEKAKSSAVDLRSHWESYGGEI